MEIKRYLWAKRIVSSEHSKGFSVVFLGQMFWGGGRGIFEDGRSSSRHWLSVGLDKEGAERKEAEVDWRRLGVANGTILSDYTDIRSCHNAKIMNMHQWGSARGQISDRWITTGEEVNGNVRRNRVRV
jgi:hypothetical protein